MITSRLIHPTITSALAQAGHGSTVLIADGHYPARTTVGPNAITVFLNLEPGAPTVPAVLSVLLDAVPIERAILVRPPDTPPSRSVDTQAEVRQLLGDRVPIEQVARHDFYDLARSPDLALCVVTGDTTRFANVLLTVGVLGTTPR